MRNTNKINYKTRKKTTYFNPPKPTSWMVLPLILAGVLIGILGFGSLSQGGEGGAAWEAQTLKKVSSLSVLAAAPLSSSLTGSLITTPGRSYAPPPYVSWVLLSEHPKHRRPSSCCAPPVTANPYNVGPRLGTIGIASGSEIVDWAAAPGGVGGEGSAANAEERCTTVDMWDPDDIMSAEQAPTMNDPNASVTLDISPPKHKTNSDCVVWRRHKRFPPTWKGHGGTSRDPMSF